MKIAKKITDLIGNTPLQEFLEFNSVLGLKGRVMGKLESFNPGGSVKDRAALVMIDDALARGVLKPGGRIIEGTSGNFGIGLALVASVKGLKVTLTMPDTMSRERRNLLAALGAELILTPGAEGMKGALVKANELLAADPPAVMLGQFENPANPAAHRVTAEEIWRDTDGKVDIFVASVGTGGTVSGAGRRLKELNPAVRIVAVEPAASPLLEGGKAAPHKIQGIGANFIPKNYDASVVDRVMAVEFDDAVRCSRLLAKHEGVLVGISSGAALSAASVLAAKPANAGKVIVALLPDTGERYLTTQLFAFNDYPL